MNNKRDLALIDFLDATGCRVSEVSNMDVADINFDKNEVLVRCAKGNKQRIVYITDVAALHLREYLAERKVASTALFTSKSGKRLSKNGIEAACKRLEVKSGVENIHPHRWRRTFATRALSNGMSLQYVSLLLGHCSYDTTKIYVAENQEDIMIAYKKYVA
jgi:site-specific recombinase XerD